jgi:hypothetical protein
MEAARRRRSASVTIGLTAILAASLSACADEAATHQAVCVDQQQRRAQDAECRSSSHGSGVSNGGRGWYYVPVGRRYPAVGEPASGGTFTQDRNMVVGTDRLSARGGTAPHGVVRGGFGGSGGHGHGG